MPRQGITGQVGPFPEKQPNFNKLSTKSAIIMPYDLKVAARIRNYLLYVPDIKIEEKKMFGGLAFMVNGKMCINVSGPNLMCRYDPGSGIEMAGKVGFAPMIMRGRIMEGYCYIHPEGFQSQENFEYYMNACLSFNKQAKASSG